jgi:DNA-binding XRE family transcriptional regulator
MKTRHTDTQGEIMIHVPPVDIEKVSEVIRGVLELAGHTVRRVNEEGEGLHTLEEVFPDAHPGRIVRGLRVKEDITQEELAKRLGIAQTRVSEIESGKRPISRNMAKRLGEAFNISSRAFI